MTSLRFAGSGYGRSEGYIPRRAKPKLNKKTGQVALFTLALIVGALLLIASIFYGLTGIDRLSSVTTSMVPPAAGTTAAQENYVLVSSYIAPVTRIVEGVIFFLWGFLFSWAASQVFGLREKPLPDKSQAAPVPQEAPDQSRV